MDTLKEIIERKSLDFSKNKLSVRTAKGSWKPINLIIPEDIFVLDELIIIGQKDKVTLDQISKKLKDELTKKANPLTKVSMDLKRITENYDFYNDMNSLAEDYDLFIINKKTQRRAGGINWRPLSKRIACLNKDILNDIKVNSPMIRTTFDPNLESGLIKSTDDELVHQYNLYEAPAWEYLEATGEPDPLVIKFYDHLIPDSNQRKIFFSEINHIITSRLQIAQLLFSKVKGTGKNTYVNHMKHLVGPHNYFPLESGFLSNNFSGEIRHRRLLFIDEARLTNEKDKDKFKSLLNDEIPTQAKFQETTKSKNYASFILAVNHSHSIWVEPNDRRFSIYDVTETKLEKSFTKQEIKTLVHKLFTDAQEQKNFHDWILREMDKEHTNNDYFLKSKKASEIIRQTARDPYKHIMDALERDPKPVTYITLKGSFKTTFQERGNRFPPIEDIKLFFDDFKPWPEFKPFIDVDLDTKMISPLWTKAEVKKKKPNRLDEELI